MKPTSISPEQFLINKAIQLAKLKTKELESYSNSEIFRITEIFGDPKMLEWKEKLGEKVFHSALNLVSFTESEEEEDPSFDVYPEF